MATQKPLVIVGGDVKQIPTGNAVAADAGGTGHTSFAIGDIFYADSTSTLAKLANSANTYSTLRCNGAGAAPSWATVYLSSTNAVSGTLPVARGGTGVGTLTGLAKGNGTGAFTAAVAGTDYAAPATTLAGYGITDGYAHPTGDGNLHVPATGTTNGGKVLTAGATAGSLTWETPAASGGSGTVTSVAVVSANGFAGTVATAGTTPAITLTTSVTGVLKGAGAALSAATAGTDFIAPNVESIITALQKFNSSAIAIKGSSTGVTTFASANNGTTNYTITFPAVTGTVLTTGTTLTVGQGGTGATTLTGLLKGNGTGAFTAAVSGTDYLPATSITGIVKSSGTTRSAAVAGTDYQAPIGTISGLVKGNGANALTAAVAGTDYVTASSTNTLTNKTISGGAIDSAPIGNTTRSTGKFTSVSSSGGGDFTGSTSFFSSGSNFLCAMDAGNNHVYVNNLKAGTLAGAGNRAVYSDASGYLTNSSSDISLKKNISTIADGLDKALLLNPVRFNWKQPAVFGAQQEMGFIAQEVQVVVPEVIGVNSDGTLSLDYPKLTALLISAVKEQHMQITELINRVNLLENK